MDAAVPARPVLIMAGGTGGHVFPALALARLLRSRSYQVVWLGTRRGLEARIVPANDFPIEWLSVGGLRGSTIAERSAKKEKKKRDEAQRVATVHCAGGGPAGPQEIRIGVLVKDQETEAQARRAAARQRVGLSKGHGAIVAFAARPDL